MAVLSDTIKGFRGIWGGKKWSYTQIAKDKSMRLLFPGLVFSIISFAVKIAFPGEVSRQTGLSFNEIVNAYLFPYDNPMRELWFIVTLFWLMMLAPLWKALLKNNTIMWGGLIVFTILHFFHPQIDLLCLGRVFSYAIWFYLGMIISKEELVDKYMMKQPWLVFLIGVVIYIAGGYTLPFITTIGGITLSFGLALIADIFIPWVFFSFRKYTYQIFLIGIFAQIAVKILYRYVAIPYEGAFLLFILAGLYVPVVVSKFIEWINLKPLLLCVGLKYIK